MSRLRLLAEELGSFLVEKKTWPDRHQIDYWRTMPDGLKIGFFGDSKKGDGIPVAGPRSMTGINSPLSSNFKKSLPKGSFQEKAAKKPNMTMSALRFMQSVFGDEDVEDYIKKVDEWSKGVEVDSTAGPFDEAIMTKDGGSWGMAAKGYLASKKSDAPYSGAMTMLGHMQDHYGSSDDVGPMSLNLILQLFGVGGSNGKDITGYNIKDGRLSADGTINKAKTLSDFYGAMNYRVDGKPKPYTEWDEEDVEEVERRVKEFLREAYALNQWALRLKREEQKAATSNVSYKSFIDSDGMMGITRGTTRFSGVSYKDTAAVAAVATKYNLGVLCAQRPMSGFSLGPGNPEGTFPGGGSIPKPEKLGNSGWAESDSFVVRTAMPIEACFYAMYAFNFGFSNEAEVMMLGASEVPMRVTNVSPSVLDELPPKVQKEIKKKMETEGFTHIIPDKSGKKVDVKASFMPGGMDYKGVTEFMSLHDFEDFLLAD